jgi:60 kDa SS-A/Ro ribonucleoprotein
MLPRDAAAGLAVVLREVCEEIVLAAFSDEMAVFVGPIPRGATLAREIAGCMPHGGTCLGHAVGALVSARPDLDRLVVLTDEQSSDRVTQGLRETYIVNLASYQRGVSWNGPVMRINGWSGLCATWRRRPRAYCRRRRTMRMRGRASRPSPARAGVA